MKILVKRSFKLLPTLAIALIVGSGMMTNCRSAADGGGRANDNSSAVTQQNKSAAVADKRAEGNASDAEASTETEQNKLVTVYDGRDAERKEKEATSAEKQSVKKEFKRRETVIMEKSKLGCSEDETADLSIAGVAEGAFTAPNSSQKAFLYEWCRSGRSFGIGGIMVIENEKVAAHYIYGENGLYLGILSLSDVNKNGLSEIVLIGGGTGQGYTTGAIDMFEFKAGNFDFLGRAKTYSDNSGAAEGETKTETIAYKISVQPSAKPVFFRETYEQKDNPKWSLVKKREKFSPDKAESGKFIKIS